MSLLKQRWIVEKDLSSVIYIFSDGVLIFISLELTHDFMKNVSKFKVVLWLWQI